MPWNEAESALRRQPRPVGLADALPPPTSTAEEPLADRLGSKTDDAEAVVQSFLRFDRRSAEVLDQASPGKGEEPCFFATERLMDTA